MWVQKYGNKIISISKISGIVLSRCFVIPGFLRDKELMGFGGGEWEVQMGLMSTPCTNCGISWATTGGRDGAVVTHNGGKGDVRRVTWGGCWCDHLTRVGSARWWWVHSMEWWGCQCLHLALTEGMRWWWVLAIVSDHGGWLRGAWHICLASAGGMGYGQVAW